MPRAAQVHACGVLHDDVELRNFVLASQPAAAGGGGAAGRAGHGGGGSRSGDGEQPCVMLLDFGLAKLVDEAAEEWGIEPAQLFQQEREELRQLLLWESPLLVPVGAGSGSKAPEAAAASGGSGGDVGNGEPGPDQRAAAVCVEREAGSSAAASCRPSPPEAAHGRPRPSAGLLPVSPPRQPCGLGGWRQQHNLRSHVPHNNRIRLLPARHGGRGAAASLSWRTTPLRTTWGF